ncbi:hypothetical protein VIGAN_01281700 [Vigna angularis var. angularis]|uniref:Uncharacterized protein n=1 Tax=Vigna angularis var. angularis TaxID=157739 RepID=A0A0S3R3K2_PHAAN|nr:hypothetical protein VIGAN_01281700 [Vigna angularis var. angularis]
MTLWIILTHVGVNHAGLECPRDDYLDCFGDPDTIGKIGTDIEDFKCSWLVAKALKLSNEKQKKVPYDNYGSADPENVAKVKALYNELNLKV